VVIGMKTAIDTVEFAVDHLDGSWSVSSVLIAKDIGVRVWQVLADW
jgi:hypothetical protein